MCGWGRMLTMVAKLSSASTMSAACLATAVPDPMAMPMSARLRAGASLTPSPVMATTCPYTPGQAPESTTSIPREVFEELPLLEGLPHCFSERSIAVGDQP